MMENVYFGAAKLTLDEINFACRALLPLDYSWWVAKHTHVSASHATPFISIILVLFGVASFAETRHEFRKHDIRLHLGRFETHLID